VQRKGRGWGAARNSCGIDVWHDSSVCLSVSRWRREMRGKVGKEVHIVFAVLFELCFSMLFSAAMQPFPCLTPALLVNLQLKAKHVLVASK